MTSGSAAPLRALFLTLRRRVVGRSLTVRAGKVEVALTVTEFDSQVEFRGLAVGQLCDVHIEARDISWDDYRFDHAIVEMRNVHLRQSAPSVMVAAPVELTVTFSTAIVEELVRQAVSQFTAELGTDGIARLRWARHPTWGHVEVDIQVVGTALWLKPLAVVIGRRRLPLPASVPVYPLGLPELPHGVVITRASVESGSLLVHGLLPQWHMDTPLGRLEEIVQQLGSRSGQVTLPHAARMW